MWTYQGVRNVSFSGNFVGTKLMIPKFLLFPPRFSHVEKFFCEALFSSILKMEGEGQAGKCVIFVETNFVRDFKPHLT